MAFRDFTFPEVQQTLGLTLAEANLFEGVSAVEPSSEFASRMRAGVDLALAINTEKARSEFIIAPVLMKRGEVWMVRFDPSVGTEIRKSRPAVVVNLDAIGRLPSPYASPLLDWELNHFFGPPLPGSPTQDWDCGL
jgi:hypothetical protein